MYALRLAQTVLLVVGCAWFAAWPLPVVAQNGAAPAPAGSQWSNLFGGPGAVSNIYALAISTSGTLYAGGRFPAGGGEPTDTVAMWNGGAWLPLASRMDAMVDALAVDSTGKLYAGGYFTHVNGVAARHVAMWNGASWSALGSGLEWPVATLALDATGKLYAAGGTYDAYGARSYVYQWDGHTWSLLGGHMLGAVQALAADDRGNLYAGGGFGYAGDVAVNNVARWNGLAWSPLGSGVDSAVSALAWSPSPGGAGHLYAGGEFRAAGGKTAHHVAQWDGTAWYAMDAGTDYGGIYALAVDDSGTPYAGGYFEVASGEAIMCVARWDGGSWSPLGGERGGEFGDEMGSMVRTLVYDAAGGGLYSGGDFATIGGALLVNHVARWDGSAWLALGGAMPSPVKALASSPSPTAARALVSPAALYTAGSLNNQSYSVFQQRGGAWTVLGSSMNGPVNALAFDGAGLLYAGGDFTAAGAVVNHIAVWDGRAWSPLGSGIDGSVHALACDGSGNLYAGGSFAHAGGAPAGNIARWDGSSWSPLGSGVNGSVRALAFDGAGSLYAGGDFATAGGAPANSIARWDGGSWSPVGSGTAGAMGGSIHALAYSPAAAGFGSLYAGGWFETAGGTAAGSVARWDGSTWLPLGGDVNGVGGGRVNALVVDLGGRLYAGGRFDSAGGVSATNIAMWNGSAWSPLGSGVDNEVRTLALDHNESLYVGGDFTNAGGKPSIYIGRWEAVRSLYLPLVKR